jgi:hypothetical protein
MNLMTRLDQTRHQLPSNRSRRSCHKHSHHQLLKQPVMSTSVAHAAAARTGEMAGSGASEQAFETLAQQLDVGSAAGTPQDKTAAQAVTPPNTPTRERQSLCAFVNRARLRRPKWGVRA